MLNTLIESFETWTSAQGMKSKGRVKSIDNIRLEGISKLRDLILYLAVRGKLVKQEERDEPILDTLIRSDFWASNGLKEINDDYDPNMPFEIPHSWCWCRMENLCGITGGYAFKSSNYSEEGYRVIRISDFDESGFKSDYTIRHTYTDELAPFLLESGDILLAMTGGTVGKSYLVSSLPEPMVVNQRVATIKTKQPINECYIRTVVLSKLVQSVIDEAKNSTNDNISMSDIREFLIPLPPLAEQHRIVAKVDELMALCHQLEAIQTRNLSTHQALVTALLQTLTQAADANELQQAWQRLEPHFDTLFCTEDSIDQLKQTILQLAIMGRLVPQDPNDEPASILLKKIAAEKAKLVKEGKLKKEKPLPEIKEEEKPFELPKGWEWCRWRDLLSIDQYSMKRGPFGSSLRKDMFVDKGIRVFEQYNPINDDPYWVRYFIDNNKYQELKAFTANPGDLLVSCSGATLGRITELPSDVELGIINQALLKITLDQRIMMNRYFVRLFRSSYLQDIIFEEAGGSAIPNMVGVAVLKEIFIPLPPTNQQERIIARLNELMSLCNSLKSRLAKSQELQNALAVTVAEQAVR